MVLGMELSQRLQAVAELVTQGKCAADIGCDHGYVSIWLVQKGICPHVIAMDINQGPLQRAKENIAAYGMKDYIETRLSDGAMMLRENEAQSLILAGMGGRLMLRILQRSSPVTETVSEWILQPQSEISLVRRTLRQQGHHIVAENMIEEDKKFYPMFRVVPQAGSGPDRNGRQAAAFDKYGELLLRQRHPVLKRYLQWEKKKLTDIQKQLEAGQMAEPSESAQSKSALRRQEIQEEQVLADYALAFYQD